MQYPQYTANNNNNCSIFLAHCQTTYFEKKMQRRGVKGHSFKSHLFWIFSVIVSKKFKEKTPMIPKTYKTNKTNATIFHGKTPI